jgi:hypothetical protein
MTIADLIGVSSCLFHLPVSTSAADAAVRALEQPEVHLGSLGGALVAVAAIVLLATFIQAIRQLGDAPRRLAAPVASAATGGAEPRTLQP